MMHSFGLHPNRPRRFVPFRTGFPLGQQPLLQPADKCFIFAMRSNDQSELLGQRAFSTNIFSETGNIILSLLRGNAPGGKVVLEYINESVTYFDGAQYVPLEAGRTFPIFGDNVLNPNYSFAQGLDESREYFLPTGQLAISVQALNSEPVTISEGINQLDENDDGEATEPGPILITANNDFSLGNVLVAERHGLFDVRLRNSLDRDLMGRIRLDRISEGAPVFSGDKPVRRQGPFIFLNDISTSTSTNSIRFALPQQGDYDMLVSRGPLHEIQLFRLNVPELDATPATTSSPLIDVHLGVELAFDGYFSADFDVRSAGDPLGFLTEIRLMHFAYSEDLDVLFMANSHHQSLVEDSFKALAFTLGGFDSLDRNNNIDSFFDELIVSRATATIGHVAGSFGDRGRFALLNLPGVEERAYLEAPVFTGGPATFFDEARTLGEDILIHVTRPRAPKGLETGYFNVLTELAGLPPNTPLSAGNPYLTQTPDTGSTTCWLDFDLLQVLSGNAYDEYLLVRQDWFNLLNAGIFKPATGGSFPWQTKDLPIGTLRSWVAVGDTTHRDNDLSEFWASVREGHMFVSNGPLIEASINGVTYGGRTNVSGDSVTAQVKISAVPWIPIRELRVVVNGVATVLPVTFEADNVRFEGAVDFPLPPNDPDGEITGHWIVFEVGASLEEIASGQADTAFYGQVYPGHVPIAFTNPIFLNYQFRDCSDL